MIGQVNYIKLLFMIKLYHKKEYLTYTNNCIPMQYFVYISIKIIH